MFARLTEVIVVSHSSQDDGVVHALQRALDDCGQVTWSDSREHEILERQRGGMAHGRAYPGTNQPHDEGAHQSPPWTGTG